MNNAKLLSLFLLAFTVQTVSAQTSAGLPGVTEDLFYNGRAGNLKGLGSNDFCPLVQLIPTKFNSLDQDVVAEVQTYVDSWFVEESYKNDCDDPSALLVISLYANVTATAFYPYISLDVLSTHVPDKTLPSLYHLVWTVPFVQLENTDDLFDLLKTGIDNQLDTFYLDRLLGPSE